MVLDSVGPAQPPAAGVGETNEKGNLKPPTTRTHVRNGVVFEDEPVVSKHSLHSSIVSRRSIRPRRSLGRVEQHSHDLQNLTSVFEEGSKPHNYGATTERTYFL